ncbi:hypothetical protein OG453_31520 [Streptomyces sp. NBC_01381]|uniref:hypothetical protein n=1 Tax=Streptomyces sp. NBC_01381 TaxID=2903845 RepID=UPI00224C8D87|nr:hypothetical protein [Streptomyces sp. NBC_01381]MCX4671164.1 hypothetical protein [Streptomyces sp. NBC_01381]
MLTKSPRDIAKILEAYDLTRCAFSAARLAGCDPKTVKKYVDRRQAGLAPGQAARRPRVTDPFLPKIEELVDHSKGRIRADVVHQRLVAMGFTGTERTTRRAVTEVKAAWKDGHWRHHRPWVPEPGMWLQADWGQGPTVAGRRTQLFCAWLSWSRFRVLLPAWDRTPGTWVSCLDTTLRRIGGVPTYVLTGASGTVTVDRALGNALHDPQLVAAGTHYGCTVAACEAFSPQAPGGVEEIVRITEADLVPTTAPLRGEYGSLAELTAACDAWCEQANTRAHRAAEAPPVSRLVAERDHLHPVPAAPYDAVLGEECVIDNDQTIGFSAARYPAPPGFAGARVWCRAVGDELAITAMTEQGLEEIARHRLPTPGSCGSVDAPQRNLPDSRAAGHLSPPPPHRASSTTTDREHELGEPLERLLCARLSVFAGGFDLSAAQAVCSGGPLSPEKLTPLLDALVAKSIVGRRADGPGSMRYDMQDTVREQCGQWLEDLGEVSATRRRHRDFHLDLAHRADAEWMGPVQVYWYERMAAEHANLRAALEFCLSEGDGSTALEMGGALWFFWFGCGHAREGYRYLQRALDLGHEPDPRRCADPRYAKALWACGITAIQQGDGKASSRLGAQLRKAAHDTGSPDMLAAASYLQGSSLRMRGALARAVEVFAVAPGSPGGEGSYEAAWPLLRLARSAAHARLGEAGPALATAQDLGRYCTEIGDTWMGGWAHYARALATLELGRPDEAAALARSAVEGTARLNDSFGCAAALDLKASAIAAAGRGKRAAHLLGTGQQIWQTLGRPQMGMPQLVAARMATELRIRHHIGDTAYQTEYRAALETDTETGIAQCLTDGV